MRLDDDPRWQRFANADFRCPCCGASYGGIFDIGYDHPDIWTHGNLRDSGQEVLGAGEDLLTYDLCHFDGNFFVRCTLPIPVIGTGESFAYGAWGSVSEATFRQYCETYDDETGFEGGFSWLSNSLPGWDAGDPLPCNLRPGAAGKRPVLYVQEESGHSLAEAQRIGITFDRLLDLYEASGTNVRKHLEAH